MRHPCLLLLLLLPSPSRAGGCVAAEKLRATTLICEDNHQYQAAGMACLAELELAVKKQRAATAAALSKHNSSTLEDGRNRQAANFGASAEDYRLAAGAFDSLLAKARETERSLDSYRDGVVYPSDWQDHSGSQAELLGALWAQACYAGAAGALDSGLSRARAIRAELEAAKEETAKLERTSGGRLTGITAHSPAAVPIRSGDAAGSGRPGKNSRVPAGRSTITGSTKKATLPEAAGGSR